MVAGDAADDRLGAQLIACLQRQRPTLRFVGMAGPRMQAQGGESYRAIGDLVMRDAVTEQGKAGALQILRARVTAGILEARPKLFVGVGTPELSLWIARRLRSAGVPCVQLAGPAVWAWRGWRVRRFAAILNHALARFPFEATTYERAGIPATFVGHPLADEIPLDVDKAAARTQLRLPHGKRVIALMPGERSAEIRATGETLVKAVHRIYSEVTDVHFVLPVTSRRDREHFESALRLHRSEDSPLTLLFGHAHDALAAADLALIASETASLEAMLFKTPMILVQPSATVAQRWSQPLMRRPPVGLPNRLAGEGIVPELPRKQATPWALAAALMALMRDTQAQSRQVERFKDLHLMLRQDSVAKASTAVLALLEHATV